MVAASVASPGSRGLHAVQCCAGRWLRWRPARVGVAISWREHRLHPCEYHSAGY